MSYYRFPPLFAPCHRSCHKKTILKDILFGGNVYWPIGHFFLRWWFSVMKQSLILKKVSLEYLPLVLQIFHLCIGMLYVLRRLFCQVSVWTAWLTTSSKQDIFLEVLFFFYNCFFYFLWVIWSWTVINDSEVFQVLILVPWQVLFFAKNLISNNSKVLRHWTDPGGSFYQYSTTNPPIWRPSVSVSYSFSENSLAWKNKTSRAYFLSFFSSKKIHEHLPLPVLSLVSRRWLFLDCLTICCSEYL